MASAAAAAGNPRGLAAFLGEGKFDGDVTFREAVVAVGEMKITGPLDEPFKSPATCT